MSCQYAMEYGLRSYCAALKKGASTVLSVMLEVTSSKRLNNVIFGQHAYILGTNLYKSIHRFGDNTCTVY